MIVVSNRTRSTSLEGVYLEAVLTFTEGSPTKINVKIKVTTFADEEKLRDFFEEVRQLRENIRSERQTQELTPPLAEGTPVL